MSTLSNNPNIIKLEAKSSDELEKMFSSINQAFTPLSIYGMNGRHYAWLSLHAGVKKKVVKSRVITRDHKKTKVKI